MDVEGRGGSLSLPSLQVGCRMQIMKILDKFDSLLSKTVTYVATAAMTITFIVMLLQVFLRRLFNSPLVWAEDLSVFFFIWITFLGATVLFQKKTLSSVDTVVMMLSLKVRLLVEALADLIVAFSSFYLLKLSFDFMKRQQALGHKLGGALGIPIWIVTLSVIISFALIILFGLTSFFRKFLIFKASKGATA